MSQHNHEQVVELIFHMEVIKDWHTRGKGLAKDRKQVQVFDNIVISLKSKTIYFECNLTLNQWFDSQYTYRYYEWCNSIFDYTLPLQ